MQHIFPLNRGGGGVGCVWCCSVCQPGRSVRWIDFLSQLQRHQLNTAWPASRISTSLIFLSEPEGPSFHRLTKALPVCGRRRCMCVCVCVCWTLRKHNRGKEGKKKRLLGKRGRFLNPLPPSSFLSGLGCGCVGTAGRGAGGETVNQ